MNKTKPPTPNPNLYPVVVAVDFDNEGVQALQAAVGMARMGLMELHVCHAVEPRPELDTSERHMRVRLKELIDFTRPHIPNELDERIHLHLTFDTPSDALVQLAVDVDARLLVVGNHGKRGVERLTAGSVSASLLKRAPCPVLVANPPAAEPRSKVPVIYDVAAGPEHAPYRMSTRGVTVGQSS